MEEREESSSWKIGVSLVVVGVVFVLSMASFSAGYYGQILLSSCTFVCTVVKKYYQGKFYTKVIVTKTTGFKSLKKNSIHKRKESFSKLVKHTGIVISISLGGKGGCWKHSSISNGQLTYSNSDLTDGSIVTFSCNSSLYVSGPLEKKCQASVWTPDDPVTCRAIN